MRDQKTSGAKPNNTSITMDTWIALLSGEGAQRLAGMNGGGNGRGIAAPSSSAPATVTLSRTEDMPQVPPQAARIPSSQPPSSKRIRKKAERFKAICDLYGNVCLCCGQAKPLTIDHVIPKSKGGSNHATNWQPLCQRCNSRKGVSSTDYRSQMNEELPVSFTRSAPAGIEHD